MTSNDLWQTIQSEVRAFLDDEPRMSPYFTKTVLDHACLKDALAFHIAEKLANTSLPESLIRGVAIEAMEADEHLVAKVEADLIAIFDRDPACDCYSHAYLYSKGFLALQTMRIAHWLWINDQRQMALLFENEVNITYGVDIHPAARIGRGILVDHATGIVIGETAVVGDNVSMLHGVTLGGTGKTHGDRHPKVGDGVLLGARCTVLGNVKLGEGAKVGAGSMVLTNVPEHTTVVGVPARVVGDPSQDMAGLLMNHCDPCMGSGK